MASFTDKISQFNPYIQQLPAQEMQQVGMYKQQQYDQGVQKIQGYIDNVAGMSVSRDVDKQHLQSSLANLGSKLKTVAAGDFSNHQLVNSVGGMATSIVKDPIIQAAVSSTANDKQQLEEMEVDKKKGTLTPHAEYVYQLKRASYLNNDKLVGDDGKPITFGGKYIKSWDIEKNMQEAIKAVGDSKWTAEQVFVIDEVTGKYKHEIVKQKDPKTGKIVEIDKGPMLSPYAVKEIREGRFSENVQAAINGVLSRPEARQELTMQGIYNYRGYTDKNDFIKQYHQAKEEGVSLLEARKVDLMAKKIIEKDPEKVKLYEAALTKVDSDIVNLTSLEDSQILAVENAGSLDAYKGALQTQVKKNDWMRAFVTERTSKTYEKSAPWEAHRQQIEDERGWWSKQDESKRGWAGVEISRSKLALDAEKWKYDPKNPKSENFDGKSELPIEAPVKDYGYLGDFIAKGQKVQDNFDSNKNKFVIDYMLALNTSNGKSISRDEVAAQINKWNSSDPGFINRTYEKAKTDVKGNPKAFPTLSSGLNVVTNAEKALEAHAQELKEIDNSPEVLAAGKNIDFSKLGKGIKPFTITYDEPDEGFLWNRNRPLFGTPKKISLAFTPQDIILASTAANNGIFKSSAEKAMAKQAEATLVNKFGRPITEIFGVLGIWYAGGKINGGILLANGVDENNIKNIVETNNTVVGKIGGAVMQAKEAAIKAKEMGNSPLMYSIYPTAMKPAEKENIDNHLKTYLNTFTRTGVDVSKFEEAYSGTGAMKDKYNVVVNADRGTAANPDQQLTLDLYDGKQLIQSVPLTPQGYKAITGKQLNIPAGVSDAAKKIQWSGNKRSTNSLVSNPTDPNASNGAFFDQSAFKVEDPRILGGDIFESYGGYNAYIYVKSPDGTPTAIPIYHEKKNNTPLTFPNADAAETYLKGISTPGQISYFIDNSKK